MHGLTLNSDVHDYHSVGRRQHGGDMSSRGDNMGLKFDGMSIKGDTPAPEDT